MKYCFIILYIICHTIASFGQSTFLSLYEDVKKEDLKLLELTYISDTSSQDLSDSLPSNFALVNGKRIFKGCQTPEKYNKLFCTKFSIEHDSLNLFSICDTSSNTKNLYDSRMPRNRINISLFKVKLGHSKYLLYNKLMGYFEYETIICSIYDTKKNEITDIVDVGLSAGACGYHNELQSRFCLECVDYQILSSSLLITNPDDSIYNFADSIVPKYYILRQTYSYKINGDHFIGTEIPKYTKSYYDIQDKKYDIELPPYNELFKKQ